MPYPHAGFGEDYIDTPSTTKHGLIVPVTREAIFFDHTHLVLSRAAEVGEVLGLNKEKRLIDLVIGANNNYKWKGVSYQTYYQPGENGPWANVLHNNKLVDWTNVDAAEQMFADILDPNTGEPVLVTPTTVLVMPAYRHAANRVFKAAEISYQAPASATATTAANPLSNYRVVDSRLVYRRIIAAGTTETSPRLVVPRRFPPGLRLHGELADHRHSVAGQQRSRFQPGHRRSLQGQRTAPRCSIPLCRAVHGRGLCPRAGALKSPGGTIELAAFSRPAGTN